MPPPPVRIELVSAAPTAWSQSSIIPVAPIQSTFVPPQNQKLSKRGGPTSPTVSPQRGGGGDAASTLLGTSLASPTASVNMGLDRAANQAAARAAGGANLTTPTMLEVFLNRLSIADRALPTLMMFAGRRRARKTFATVGEWRLSRDMDHLIHGTVNTALRDAQWRWKLLQSFVLRQDCVSSYRPPLRHSYSTVTVRSRLPPPAPRVPHAEELKALSLEQAVDHLHQFETDMSVYLRTTWVPEDKERIPKSVEQVRQQSEKRMCALLELSDPSVLQNTRLGAAMNIRAGVAMDRADTLLLSKERATSALLIRPQFVMKKSEREELDPRDRLKRMQRYGWQVREQLFAPSALQDIAVLDAEVQATVAALTPRERARSALLDVPPLEQVVGRGRLQESVWACEMSETDDGTNTWSDGAVFGRPQSRASSPAQRIGNTTHDEYAQKHFSPGGGRRGGGGADTTTTDSKRIEAPHEHHVLDFSFCDLECFHQLLFVEPRRVGVPPSDEGSQQHHTRPPSPASLSSTLTRRSSSRQGSLSQPTNSGHHKSPLVRRGSIRRGHGVGPANGSPGSQAHRAVVHALRLRHVFSEKDDNEVQLSQMATEVIERSQSPLLKGGHSAAGSGHRRRSSVDGSGLGRTRTGSIPGFDLQSPGGSRQGSIDVGGVPASEPTRLSPRMVTIADKRDLVARKGIAVDLLAYLDHPSVGQYLSINHQHEVRPANDSRRFPEFEIHELRLNDNHLGAPVTKLSTKHRVLHHEDGRRGTRNDPDVTLWKHLVQIAAQEELQHHEQHQGRRGSQQQQQQQQQQLMLAGKQQNVVIDGTRFAALFVRCLTAISAAETITTLDLSGNAFSEVPVELVGQLRGLKQLKLHRNRLTSLMSVAVLCGLMDKIHTDRARGDDAMEVSSPTNKKSSRVAISPKEYRLSRTRHFPFIRFQLSSLTLYGNPAQEAYGLAAYRGFLLTAFPNLKMLDAGAVTISETEELWAAGRTFYV